VTLKLILPSLWDHVEENYSDKEVQFNTILTASENPLSSLKPLGLAVKTNRITWKNRLIDFIEMVVQKDFINICLQTCEKI